MAMPAMAPALRPWWLLGEESEPDDDDDDDDDVELDPEEVAVSDGKASPGVI